MSKNRLLQIINRLKLTPKDKKDLVNIIESDQEVSLGTPDWDANEGEEGYIKNRTHSFINYIGSISKNGDSIITERETCYYPNIIVKTEAFIKKIEIIYDNNISINFGPPVSLKFSRTVNNKLEITLIDKYGYITSSNVVKFFSGINFIDDIYMPYTIARVADYELPHIKLDISQNDSNVTTLNDNSVSLTDRCVCDLYNGYYDKENALIHNGELYNGVITGIKEGKLVQYNVNLETGEITLKHEIDIAELYNKISSL